MVRKPQHSKTFQKLFDLPLPRRSKWQWKEEISGEGCWLSPYLAAAAAAAAAAAGACMEKVGKQISADFFCRRNLKVVARERISFPLLHHEIFESVKLDETTRFFFFFSRPEYKEQPRIITPGRREKRIVLLKTLEVTITSLERGRY